MPDAIEKRLIEVAAEYLKAPLSSLSLDSGPGAVARWDSFAHVCLIAAAESAFDVVFDVDDIATFVTLRDIHDAIAMRSAQ